MAELQSEQCTVIWYADLEKFIKEIFNKEANILDHEECNNDSYKQTEVGKGKLLNIDQEEYLLRWLSDDEPSLGVVEAMYLLYTEGHIPEGKYLVSLWW